MSIESQEPDPSPADPRHAQKSRTRAALLDAARAISRDGGLLTVAAAADRAGISKATAYRYFTDPGTLAYEATLDLIVKSPAEIVGDSPDVRARVHRAAQYFRAFPRDNEGMFRQFFARTMDNWITAKGNRPLTRGARRIPAFALALDPVRGLLPPDRFERLVLALASSATGFEQHIAMTDVCGLTPAQSDDLGREVVEALLNHFLGPHLPANPSQS